VDCKWIGEVIIVMMGFADPRRESVFKLLRVKDMRVSRRYWMCWASETSPL